MIAAPVVLTASTPGAVAVWPKQPDEPAQTLMVQQLDEPRRPITVSRAYERPSAPPSTPPPAPAADPTTTTPAPPPTEEPKPTVVGHVYATAALKVREGPTTEAATLTVVEWGTKLGVTGAEEGKWVQIIYDGAVAWVNGDYVAKEKPKPSPTATSSSPSASASARSSGGISYAECPSGSSVESGLTPDAIRVHRAVCAEFPSVPSYGGVRSGSDGAHGDGRALDVMVYSNKSLGDAIADFVRANYKVLGVSEVIWQQRIWTVQRSSEGWRPMEDRGSPTANHMDHVHVTVYGNSGS
jgi:Bacterial SH3 domain